MTKCRFDTNSDAIEYIKVHLCVKISGNWLQIILKYCRIENLIIYVACSTYHLSPFSYDGTSKNNCDSMRHLYQLTPFPNLKRN